jgi:hypothetical protein
VAHAATLATIARPGPAKLIEQRRNCRGRLPPAIALRLRKMCLSIAFILGSLFSVASG